MRTGMSTGRKNRESGFAMLLVFAMAAIIAISLYTQIPRAAFEAQREKESLTIDHGEQYIRGIKLYVRKLGRYPAKLEDLDNTQNIRFLRKHYIDPLSGKEEWRLLHMGPAGKLIDSKIETTDSQTNWHAGSITEVKSTGSSDGLPEGVNLATRKRPSDDLTMGPMGGNPAPPTNSDPAALSLNGPPNGTPPPGTPPGTPGVPPVPGTPGFPGQVQGFPPGMPNAARIGLAGQNNTGLVNPANGANTNQNTGSIGSSSSVSSYSGSIQGNGGYGTTSTNQNPNGYGAPVNSQYQGQSPTSYSTTPGSNMPTGNNGFTNPGFGTSNSQSSAAAMIGNLLTQPRPGGAPAGVGTGMPAMGGTMVGGLAGVAPTYKGHGIRRYADQDDYQKWEFFYDYSKELTGTLGGLNTAQPVQQNNPNNNNNNTGFGGNSSSFGGNSGFGNSAAGTGNASSGFGNGTTNTGGFSSGFGSTTTTPPR